MTDRFCIFFSFNAHSTKTMIMFKKIFFALVFVLVAIAGITQAGYFYPNSEAFNAAIPTPEKFLGYAIGTHHTRHDKLVEYFKELGRLSDRVNFQIIGETFEHRPQITATFTSSANHQRLEEIRSAHLAGQLTGNTENIPLVIHLGFNVHGNEPSSSEAAMLTAYYLTASETDETKKWADEANLFPRLTVSRHRRFRHNAAAGPPVE
jgi:hypothetical protein